MTEHVSLTLDDLRIVVAYAADCAETVLGLFESHCPDDNRPREAIAAARTFALCGARVKTLRDHAFAAMRAGSDATQPSATAAARAAMAAAAAAYLHPLARASQVGHILGAASHAALAQDIDNGGAQRALKEAARRVPDGLVAILQRYPVAPPGGGRAGDLMRQLDQMLRTRD